MDTIEINSNDIDDEYQVVIVGCGPNGSVMGNLLGMYNIKTLIVESNNHINTVPRAAHLDDEAIRILQMIGLDKIVLENAFALDVQFNRYYNNKTFLNIKNTETDNGHPRSIFWYQPQFEQILADGLKRFNGHVDIILGHRVDEYVFDSASGSTLVTLKNNGNQQQPTKTVNCKYIIGADGGNSSIRKSMGSKFNGESGSMRWLVVDAILHQDHPKMNNCFQFVCDPNRPMLTLPIPCGHFRWEFVVPNNKTAEELESVRNVNEMLAGTGADPSKLTVVRKAAYTFQNRISDQWFDGDSAFIIGDAAHCLPPFLGMGVSSGMRDSVNLAWKIKMVLDNNKRNASSGTQKPLVINSKSIFESYMIERKPEVELIGSKSSMVGHVIMSTGFIISLLRDIFIFILLLFPFVQSFFANKEMKPIVPIQNDGSLVDRNQIKAESSGERTKRQPGMSQLVVTYLRFVQVITTFVNDYMHPKRLYKNNIGFRIPQPKIYVQGEEEADGATITSKEQQLDDVLGLGFSCIIINGDKDTYNQMELDSNIWKLLNTTFIKIDKEEIGDDDDDEDDDGRKMINISFCNQLQKKSFYQFINGGCDSTTDKDRDGADHHRTSMVVIIRPDKHVYGIYRGTDDISSIVHSLHNSFISM